MANSQVVIRAVRGDDDFDWIRSLLLDTLQRYMPDDKRGYGESAANLKQKYVSCEKGEGGFIAESGGRAVAFAGVLPSQLTKNGTLQCGFLEGYEQTLQELVDRCANLIRERGGNKVFQFVPVLFGQVRNKAISMWEKYGFIPDEYSLITASLLLDDWMAPESFDAAGIEPISAAELRDIASLLIEDGEDDMAVLFRKLSGGDPYEKDSDNWRRSEWEDNTCKANIKYC